MNSEKIMAKCIIIGNGRGFSEMICDQLSTRGIDAILRDSNDELLSDLGCLAKIELAVIDYDNICLSMRPSLTKNMMRIRPGLPIVVIATSPKEVLSDERIATTTVLRKPVPIHELLFAVRNLITH
jgi:hypothetical protein